MRLTQKQFENKCSLFERVGLTEKEVVGKSYFQLISNIQMLQIINDEQKELKDIVNYLHEKSRYISLKKIKSDLDKNSIKLIIQRKQKLTEAAMYIWQLYITAYNEQSNNEEDFELAHNVIKNIEKGVNIEYIKRRAIGCFFAKHDIYTFLTTLQIIIFICYYVVKSQDLFVNITKDIIMYTCVLSFISAITMACFGLYYCNQMKKKCGEDIDNTIEKCNSSIEEYSSVIAKKVKYSSYIYSFAFILTCGLLLFNFVEGLAKKEVGYICLDFLCLLGITVIFAIILNENKGFIDDLNHVKEISADNCINSDIMQATIDNTFYKEGEQESP